jgi:hypothetical protein
MVLWPMAVPEANMCRIMASTLATPIVVIFVALLLTSICSIISNFNWHMYNRYGEYAMRWRMRRKKWSIVN